MEVALFPYLPLRNRLVVGQWELIPRAELGPNDVARPEMLGYAEGVARLYRLPVNPRDIPFGAFLRANHGQVGDEMDRPQLANLRDAILFALLDKNPTRVHGQADQDLNAGHWACTSENGLLFSHRFEDDLYTAYETGTMVMTRHLGYRIAETEDIIEPPNDLKVPSLQRPDLDGVIAIALHDVLEGLAAEDPDLNGVLRWFFVAWANAAIVDAPTRVLALRAAFDLMFLNASTEIVRERLSDLLDPAGTPRQLRMWRNHLGQQRQAELTALGWWFQSFALLRNDLAHGGRVTDQAYLFDGVAHVWHAEWNLRRAIKQLVADRGHPDVLLDGYGRIARRFIESGEA